MRKVLIGLLVVLAIVVVAGGWLVGRLLDPEAVRAAVERQATAALGQPVRVGTIEWALSARPRVVLGDVRVGEPAAIQVQRVELTTGLRALFSKRVEQAGLVVSGSRVTLPLPFSLGGSSTPAASARAPDGAAGAAALAIVSVDQIALRDIELMVGAQRLVLQLESSLVGERLAVSRLRLTSDHSVIEGTGELPQVGVLRGRFTLSAERLDLDELLTVASGISASGSEGASAPAASAEAPLDLQIDLAAAAGRALGQEFSDLTARFALTRAGLVLDPIALNLLDGRLDGQLQVDTSQPQTVVTLQAGIQGMDVARLAALAGAQGAITGRLGGQVRLQARADAAGVGLATTRGTASLAVTDGTLPGLDLVRPVITAFGISGQVTAGTRAFSRLGGTFSLERGVLSSADLALASDDVDLRGQGTVTLSDLVVDLTADMVLSEQLTAQAGRDLRRYAREGNRIVLPATVRGPLREPTVFVDVGAALERATRNAIENELKKGLRRLFRP